MASGDEPKDSSSLPTTNQPLLPAVALEDGWLTPPGQLLPREPAGPPPAPRKRRCVEPQAEWSPRAEHLPLWDAYFRASDDHTPALPGGSTCAPRRTQRKLTKAFASAKLSPDDGPTYVFHDRASSCDLSDPYITLRHGDEKETCLPGSHEPQAPTLSEILRRSRMPDSSSEGSWPGSPSGDRPDVEDTSSTPSSICGGVPGKLAGLGDNFISPQSSAMSDGSKSSLFSPLSLGAAAEDSAGLRWDRPEPRGMDRVLEAMLRRSLGSLPARGHT